MLKTYSVVFKKGILKPIKTSILNESIPTFLASLSTGRHTSDREACTEKKLNELQGLPLK